MVNHGLSSGYQRPVDDGFYSHAKLKIISGVHVPKGLQATLVHFCFFNDMPKIGKSGFFLCGYDALESSSTKTKMFSYRINVLQ